MAAELSKVYRIFSTKGDKVYIGSTTQDLYKRMGRHRAEFKERKQYSSRILFEEYGIENCHIELIELVEPDQKLLRERFHIEHTANCVNVAKPCLTEKEVEESKQKAAEYHREWVAKKKAEDPIAFNQKACESAKRYYQRHREERLAYDKEYAAKNSEAIKEKGRAYYEANKDSDKFKAKNARLMEKVPCDICQVVMMRANLSRHKKLHHSQNALQDSAPPQSP